MFDTADLRFPSAVIFDMDGLMVDSEPVWAKAWEVALARQGLELKPGFREALIGLARPRALKAMFGFYGDSDEVLAAFDDHYDVAERLFIGEGAPKKPGLDELLDELQCRGVPVAAASSTARNSVDAVLEHAGVAGRFSAIRTGDMEYPSKPAPDIFLAAAEALDVVPEDTWVLEDSPAGIRAAIAGGFVPVMIPDLVQPDETLRKQVIVLDSLFDARDLLVSLG